MKNLIFCSLFALFSLSGMSQSFELIVDKGYGSGDYYEEEDVHIWAKTPPENVVFTGWTGNGTEFLKDAGEWHTTLRIPEGKDVGTIALTANFAALGSDIQMVLSKIDLWGEYNNDPSTRFRTQKPYYRVLPTDPKGIVFMFHGTGGSAHSFFKKYETFSTVKDLVYNNYGVIVLSSNETDIGDQNGDEKIRWIASPGNRDTSNNVDLKNIAELKSILISKYGFGDIPFFTYGVSNGANFSDLVSASLDFTAGVHMTGNGNATLFKLHPSVKPTLWLQARNDQNVSADSNVAVANYQKMLERGIYTEWYWLDKSPLYAQRFTRSLNNIEKPLSNDIFDAFSDNDLVDDDNILNFDIIDPDEIAKVLSPLNLPKSQFKDVLNQLKVLNADHGGHGEYNRKIIRFFDRFSETITAVEKPKASYLDIRIFPNPCANFLKIYTPYQIQSYRIFNANGEVMKEQNLYLDIDVSNLPQGTYFIQVVTDEGTTSQKFIKS